MRLLLQVGKVLGKIGTTKTLVFGLTSMGIFTILFGAAPAFYSSPSAPATIPFVVFGLLYGVTSTFAETGTYSIFTAEFADNIGKVIALGEVVTGCGAMLGKYLNCVYCCTSSCTLYAL